MIAAGSASLVPAASRVLVAVSGGADSMALLGWLLAVRAEQRDASGETNLVVAHVNHGLRGIESDSDETFVRDCCEKMEVPFVTERLALRPILKDGGAHVREKKNNEKHVNEERARRARYAALVRLARSANCAIVATGHTMSDSLETSLLFWLRGATVAGWRGIPPKRILARDVTLVRPLLEVSREETRLWCRAFGWPWREDESNGNARYKRNRVRNELLPLLCDIAARDETALAKQAARAANILADDLDCLDALAQTHLEMLTLRREPHLLALDGLGFRALPVALQRRVLRHAAQQAHGQVQHQDETSDKGIKGGIDVELEGAMGGISARQIEVARRHIAADGRRAVWSWRGGLRLEWTGAMAGNRIRLWLVEDEARECNSQPQAAAPDALEQSVSNAPAA